VAAMLAWSILRGLWRTPERIKRARRERRHAHGRHAITHGLLAIGHGDSSAARAHADVARRHAAHDPLALLLHAQSAQLDGDREGARRAFRAMAEREDTRLLGLRGLFIEAQRADDPIAAVMIAEEALKLAPTLVPSAVLASKYQSEAHQVRRSMRIVEAAWLAQPHPDLAEAYAHVKLGDSARQRLVRVETLAAKVPGHIESALAVARAAIDASEFARARQALAPFTAAPTQRVAMLMAEIERTEHGDSGRARAWTLRAVRALHDPVWTADGYVSDRWRPVSPVTGRLGAVKWQTPVAALPSDKGTTIESSPFEEAMLAAPVPRLSDSASEGAAAPPREMTAPAAQGNAAPAPAA